jgi:predicted DNA-binding transcriptional regulator AlpA
MSLTQPKNTHTDFGLRNRNEAFGLRMLTGAQVATVLGISTFTLRNMVNSGKFPPPVIVNLSKRWAIESVRAFATGQWVPPSQIPEEAA